MTEKLPVAGAPAEAVVVVRPIVLPLLSFMATSNVPSKTRAVPLMRTGLLTFSPAAGEVMEILP